MTIRTVQYNIKNNQFAFKENKQKQPYLDAKGAIDTTGNVHPLPPKGHLIHDSLGNKVKYYFKDRKYDMKALKDGIKGNANDHQSGRLNDVGLVTSGILIATYLASKTSNPKARIMEYVGLGAFLTAMSLYPKLVINNPAKLMHGYDIDKQYIDDQGRKKSVMQDSNYVPYDMYRGEVPEEDLELIGDKMGIPRDIKNRNDLTREQMRKVATQSNTLWMLTAGVTPALAALLCCGIENYVVGPALEKTQMAKFDALTKKLLQKTEAMTSDVSSISANKLSTQVEGLLKNYKGQELPKIEFDNLVKILTKDLFENTSEGVKEDLVRIFENAANGSKSYVIADDTAKKLIVAAEDSVSKANKAQLEKILVPTEKEFNAIFSQFIKDGAENSNAVLKEGQIIEIKKALKELMDSKFKNAEGVSKAFFESQRNDVIEGITKALKTEKSTFVSEESIKQVVDFAKVLGEFKENKKLLQECKSFNFEFANETLLARSYSKFEKTLLDVLGIKYGDLKKIRESETFTKELLDKKFAEIAKDEAKFQKAIEKLGKIISEMEVKLHGNSEYESKLLDLLNAVENNYNNTAKRLSEIGSFKSTINRLIKEDAGSATKRFESRLGVFNYLDGIEANKYKEMFNAKKWWELTEQEALKYLKENSKGIGSSKNLEISRILERYQGAKNSFHRTLHTFDVYKRAMTPENFAEALRGKDPEYVEAILKKAKETMLYASTSDHNLKLHTVNNPNFYKDLMNSVWAGESGAYKSTIQKGLLTNTTKEALGKHNTMASGNVLDRFQFYITRFRNLVANNNIDFTKPHHIIDGSLPNEYAKICKTRMSIFNLVGQSPVDMVKGAASRRYATQKWVRIISGISASVVGVALLSQFGFGKIRNPQNVQKQVNDVANK